MSAQPKMLAAVVDEDLAEQFKAICRLNERTVAAELRVLIKEHVEIHGTDPVSS